MSYKKTPRKTRLSRTNKKPPKKLLTIAQRRQAQKAKLVKRKLRLARPVHKRILLHPLGMMIVLCIGVAMIGSTYKAVADSYTVSAEVPAPALSQGAVIENPTNGEVFTTSPIVVSGSCPLQSYVNLYRNGIFSGSAWCSADNTFQISTDLFIGLNTLMAQDYNTTNDAGPTTPTVSVTYSPPSTSPVVTESTTTSSNAHSGSSSSAIPPLLLTTDYHFQTFLVNTPFNWKIDLEGGISPYTIQVVWNDGQTSTITLKTDQTFTISHVYQQPGYYAVNISAIDGHGVKATLQIAALIKLPSSNAIPPTGSTTPLPPTPSSLFLRIKQWLWLAWPAYLLIVLMLVSYWLGERQEYKKLLKRKQLILH